MQMCATLRGWQIWMENASRLIRSGLYRKVVVVEGMTFEIHGEYTDNTLGATLAKYETAGTAHDIAGLINRHACGAVLAA